MTIKPLHFSQKIAPEALFAYFAQMPWSIWLDSCDSTHPDSNLDIMVWQPESTLVTVGEITTINQGELATKSERDPFELLEHAIALHQQKYQFDDIDLPFNTGAVGYFGYELGRRIEKLPTLAVRDIDTPEMAIGIYSHAVVFDKKRGQYQLICPEETRQALEQQLIHAACYHASAETFKLTSEWQSNISKAQYGEKFDKVQQYLVNGDCYQINLTQRFSANYQGDEYQAYLALRRANNAPFSAFMRFEDQAILSISPERFIKVENGKVQTKPIKGTMPRSQDAAIDQANADILQASTKDRAENLMIVDLLRNDLSKSCVPGSVKVPKLFAIESFPAVHHLVSTVEGCLNSTSSATSLLRAAFPGGSITGAPKIRAMEIIDELEPQRRNLYCGSIGYISACGNMDTSITIRTLVCVEGTAYCWAGGGIVADSNVDAEYQESLDKVNKILPILSTL